MKNSWSLVLRSVPVLLAGMLLLGGLGNSLPAAAQGTPPGVVELLKGERAPTGELPWFALGYGLNKKVRAIAVSGSEIYVGGAFTEICGNPGCDTGNIPANHIAKWDGSHWSAVGNGVAAGGFSGSEFSGDVFALAVSGTDVYAGGYFGLLCGNATCDSGNTVANNIVKWDGSQWSTLGYGVGSEVSALAIMGSDVYAGGIFDRVCGNAACDTGNTVVNSIAKWDGSHWSALGHGVHDYVNTLLVNGNDLYVGGSFSQLCGDDTCLYAGNTTGNHIAKRNGGSWYTFGNGLSGGVDAIALIGSDVYVGGSFPEFCGDLNCTPETNALANDLGKWDGSHWSRLDNGVNYHVNALARVGSDLYAGGKFTQICGNVECNSGNTLANYLAKWDGSQWSAVGYGVHDSVNALALSDSKMFVGGDFRTVCRGTDCSTDYQVVNSVAQVCMSKPAAPTLGAPAPGAHVGKRPKLKWNATDCALTYRVFIKNAETGAVVLRARNLTALSLKLKPTDALASGVTYKWYVKACNTLGCTQSQGSKFTVR